MTKQDATGRIRTIPDDSSRAGAPELEITPQMLQAALEALRPFQWEDGLLGGADLRPAIEEALRAAFRARAALLK